MPQNSTQVVAGRDIFVFTEPYVSGSNVFPANTITWGTTWGGSWVDSGYTRNGLQFRLNVQRNLVLVDQVVDPVLRIPQQRDINMITQLAQVTALNLSNATGQGAVTSTSAQDDYDISGTITDQYITVGFDVRNPGDLLPIRIVGWRGLVQADVTLQFNVTEAAVIQYNVGLLPDTGSGATRVAKFRDINQ